MEIQQVIQRVDKLFPNPYTEEEKCRWCDELGAQLMREYKKPYGRDILFAERGEVFLPEHIDFSDVARIEFSGRIVPKRDMRGLGIKVRYLPRGKGAITLPASYTGEVTVSYLEKYTPIRNIHAEGAPVILGKDCFTTGIPSFCTEDILKITAGGRVYDDIYVLDVQLTSDGYEVGVQEGAFSGAEGQAQADIYRYLTDETVCPAPYDAMYIHFLCAKANFYQRDFDAYNQETAIVNTLMDAYARELKNRAPVDNDGQFMNWW